MSHQFAPLIIIHDKSVLWESVLPKFSGIVKENAGKQKIEIQFRIKGCDLVRYAHHLCRVLHESAPARVMIVPRGGGASKPIAPFFQECVAQGAQPRIADSSNSGCYELPIRLLLCSQIRRPLK